MAKVTKSEGDGNHPSTHYLVVEDPQKPTTWHLRVRNVNGDVDPRLLGAAWAALHGGYRGNKYAGPNKEEALAKLKRLYASVGKTPPGETSSKAIFYRTGDTIWFFGVYSNNFEDAQNDIISQAAHEEFTDWLKTTGIKPPITIFHQPHYPDVVHAVNYMGLVYGKLTPAAYEANLDALYKPFAIAKTERVISLNGFTFVIGKVYEHKRALVERLMDKAKTWGMSHGFIPVKSDGNIIEKYRTFEFTVAPSEFVVNQTTPIGFIRKEISEKMGENYKSLSEEDRKLVEDLLEGNADDLEEATEKAKEILSGVLASKADELPEEETQEEPQKEEEEEVVAVKATFDNAVLEQLTAVFKTIDERMVAMHNDMVALTEKVNAIEAQSQKTDDEKIAEQLFVPNWKALFADKSVETVEVDEKKVEELKKNIPDKIVQDKAEDWDNPLYAMVGSLFNHS